MKKENDHGKLGHIRTLFSLHKTCFILWGLLQKNEAVSLIGLVVFQTRLFFIAASSAFFPSKVVLKIKELSLANIPSISKEHCSFQSTTLTSLLHLLAFYGDQWLFELSLYSSLSPLTMENQGLDSSFERMNTNITFMVQVQVTGAG